MVGYQRQSQGEKAHLRCLRKSFVTVFVQLKRYSPTPDLAVDGRDLSADNACEARRWGHHFPTLERVMPILHDENLKNGIGRSWQLTTVDNSALQGLPQASGQEHSKNMLLYTCVQ